MNEFLGPLTDRELHRVLSEIRGKNPGLEKAVRSEMRHREDLHAISIRGVSWWRTSWKTLAGALVLAAVAWWLL